MRPVSSSAHLEGVAIQEAEAARQAAGSADATMVYVYVAVSLCIVGKQPHRRHGLKNK